MILVAKQDNFRRIIKNTIWYLQTRRITYLYKELHTKFQECVTMLSDIDGVLFLLKINIL